MTSRWLQRPTRVSKVDSSEFLQNSDVRNLIKAGSFDNATRTLTLEHNDATETLVQIPHTSTPNVDNLVKNVTWDAISRNLTIEKNSIHQTNSVLNIAEADLTNYYTQSQIDAKEFMEKHQEIEPGKIKIQNNEKCCWDDHSNKGLWMQDSTWVRFNARIYTESNHIATQGRIGAGTTNPGQPLHVAGKAYISSGMHVAGAYWSNNYTDSQSDYLTNGGSVQANPPYLNFGIRCDQAINCSHVVVTSDRRIKENIEDIVDDVALKQLRLLQPKTYEYKDKFEKGDKRVIGFIAQEVKDVLPNAVKLDKRAIPNILKQCSAYNKSKDVLELRLDSPMTNDITDKTIQIYVNDIPYIAKVILCEDKVVQIKKPDEMADFDEKQVVSDGDKAILYGEYVDDFHVLDKSAIFTIATAAIQELDRQLQAEKMKTLSLERRIIALEQRL